MVVGCWMDERWMDGWLTDEWMDLFHSESIQLTLALTFVMLVLATDLLILATLKHILPLARFVTYLFYYFSFCFANFIYFTFYLLFRCV